MHFQLMVPHAKQKLHPSQKVAFFLTDLSLLTEGKNTNIAISIKKKSAGINQCNQRNLSQ